MEDSLKDFSQCADLESIDLIASNFECFPGNSFSGPGRLEAAIESSHRHFDDDTSHKYQVAFEIDIKGLSDSEDLVFQLKARYALNYDLEECASSWEEEEKEFFKERSALMHVWPYIREHLDKLTQASPVPRAILQLLPIPKRKQPSQESERGE